MSVSAIIYTLNEQVHLPRALGALAGCDDVVVVDSLSTDRTEAICRAYGVRFYQHRFTGFGDQRNWTFDHVPLAHPWALVLDADEVVTPDLWREIIDRTHSADDDVAAFRLRRRFTMFGRWLRHAALYPTWVVRVVRVGHVRYINRGHAETQMVAGRVEPLQHDLIDHNLKGLDEWFARHNRYSTLEAAEELAQAKGVALRDAFARDPLVRREWAKTVARRLPFRGALYFLYSFLWRRGFLDGRAGLEYCRIKSMYQQMIAVKKTVLSRLADADGADLFGPQGSGSAYDCIRRAAG